MSTDLQRRFGAISPRLANDELDPRRYGATSHSTESALFAGYRSAADQDPRTVMVRCACGGYVTAEPDAPAKGVALHNTTGRHAAWRAAHGYDLDIVERP